ncbi:MAG: hypothetical protein HKM05_02005 [Spirochaetales bacterium]|nr:hypothetical protein [Spirochaetales bacterium]
MAMYSGIREAICGTPRAFWVRSQVMDFLAKRKSVLQGVAITGGEPLYHQDLVDLIEEIRNFGYLVKLDTNGTYPRRLEALPIGLVDFIAMDLKCAPRSRKQLGSSATSRHDVSSEQHGCPGLTT